MLDEPATAADGRPPRRDARPPRGGRAAGLRARPLELPPPRPAVDRRVLIPRPETEVVAGVAIELARAVPPPGHRRRPRHRVRAPSGWRWPTSCPSTGSRCGSPTSRRTPSTSPGPTSPASAAGRANVRIAAGSWFDALPRRTSCSTSSWPTRRTSPTASPDVDAVVREWEPHGALFAGPDGLDAIRALVAGGAGPGPSRRLAGAGDRRRPGRRGRRAASRPPATTRSTIRPDLAGRDRVAVARSRSVARRSRDVACSQPKRTAISREEAALLGRDVVRRRRRSRGRPRTAPGAGRGW